MCSNSHLIPRNPCMGPSLTNKKSPPRRCRSPRSWVSSVCNAEGSGQRPGPFTPELLKVRPVIPRPPLKTPLGFGLKQESWNNTGGKHHAAQTFVTWWAQAHSQPWSWTEVMSWADSLSPTLPPLNNIVGAGRTSEGGGLVRMPMSRGHR